MKTICQERGKNARRCEPLIKLGQDSRRRTFGVVECRSIDQDESNAIRVGGMSTMKSLDFCGAGFQSMPDHLVGPGCDVNELGTFQS